jgi:hypothetical protein
MRYTVHWTPHALQQLAELWLEAVDQQKCSDAANALEQSLRDDPINERHEVVNNLGTAVSPPIGIDFRVIEADRIVSVFAVWPAGDDLL